MSVYQGRKGAFGIVAYDVPMAGSGNGFTARSSVSVYVIDANEEAVKRRILDYLRTQNIKPCRQGWKHMVNQCDYSGIKNPSRRQVQSVQQSNADRWKSRKGGKETPRKTYKKVTKPVATKQEEPIDYSE